MSKKNIRKSKRFTGKLKLLPVLLASVCSPAHAAPYLWDGSFTTNSWTDSTNWFPAAPAGGPGQGLVPVDDIAIGSAATAAAFRAVSIPFSFTTYTINSLVFGSFPGPSAPAFTLTNNAILQVSTGSVTGTTVGNGIVNNGIMNFINSASADTTGGATFVPYGNFGIINFQNTSTLGLGFISNAGTINFQDSSAAGSPGVVGIANGGGTVNFTGTSTANNLNMTTTAAGETVNISGLTASGIAIGFINEAAAGGGIILGSKELVLGNLNQPDMIFNVISGVGGALTKIGTNTLTLIGDNTYTGNTTIGSGTVQVGNGGGTGSIVGNIVNGSALTINRTGTVTFPGDISGTGTVTKIAAGTAIFTGTNTYTGLTTISAGLLSIGNGGTGGSMVGDILDGTALEFNRSNTSTYPGNVGGAGSVTKLGAGTLIVTGALTHGGGTTISGGTLQLGNGGVTGSVAGNITDNANLAFNRSDNVTYTGLISGAGTLNQMGPGVLTFTNDHTYAGPTTISGGTLELGNGGVTGSVTGNIIDDSALIFNRSDAITFAGLITGVGTVTQFGPNVLTFLSDNLYTGNTFISAGSGLQLGNNTATGSVVGDIVDNGALIFNRSNNMLYGGVVSGTGVLIKSNANTTILTGTNVYTGGTLILGGTLQLGNGGTTGSVVGNITDNADLTFNRSNTYIYTDVISGLGTVTKEGTGTLIITNANTYTGNTNINNGTLLMGVGSSIAGSVFVNPGATLAGNGTIGQNLTNSGGIVSPGNSIGTITILGNYVQSPTGSYIVQVDQAGNSDLLNVTGTATLDGIVGISAINNGFLVNYPYTIINSAGGVIGTFSNTNIDGIFNQGFLQGRVLYFPNMVQFIVNFNGGLFQQVYQTPNQKAVGDNILITGGNPQIQSLISSLSTPDQLRRALDQLSGATYANNDMMIAQVGNTFSGEMADRFDAFPSCNCRTSVLPGGGRWGCDQKNQFWVAGHGAEDRIKSGQVSGLNTDYGNFALGYEWAAGRDTKVGLAAGYSDFSARAQVREMAKTTGNLYQVGLYARNQMGDWLLGAAVDAGVTSNLETERRIDGTFRTVTTKGSSKAHLYSEQVRLGYDLMGNRPMRLSPFIGVIGQQLNRDAFTETTATGFELHVNGSNYRSTRSQLGAMLELPTNTSIKPFVSADWEHEFSDVNSTFNANFVGLVPQFHIEGQSIGRDTALVKAGTVIACGRNWSVAALYQGWYGKSWQENGGTLEATVAFG